MGNFAALVGCPSKEAAQSENNWDRYWDEEISDNEGWGPVWLSKYCIGGFWLGCFSPEDEILIDRDGEEDGLPTFIGYFVSVDTAIGRLNSRKTAILNFVPEELRQPYSGLYDVWVQTLADQFKLGLFLDCDDIFSMIGHEEGSEQLRKHVELMANLKSDTLDVDVIDLGLTGLVGIGEVSEYKAQSASANRLVEDWRYGGTADPAVEIGDWPPEPKPEELEFAKQVISDTLKKHSQNLSKHPRTQKPWWKFW